MDISVIGCGRWGAFLAWYLDRLSYRVTLYGRSDSKRFQAFLSERTNGLTTLSQRVRLTSDLNEALAAEIVLISVNAQGLRALMGEIAAQTPKEKLYVLCMKGLETGSGKRLSEIVLESSPKGTRAAVWLGPGHVQEFTSGVPNCMVIDSADENAKSMLVDAFSSDLIRFYYGRDLIGNEVGAAAKNVIGIAAGILDALSLSSLKGALCSRGTREVARLIEAMGGDPFSAYGLCHLGDYAATVFSPLSHNRRFGEAFVKAEAYGELAEGADTAKALRLLSRKHRVELPICDAVYDTLFEGVEARHAVERLFGRRQKTE
ncbi:MAG: NAD(P)H-dependent glycerol-3-phosphate dehydrogenase [Clostridiaceae bacterium]|nr:NAD(P)H-dependent glycerol-3-phosphate dehydrogenase [Eubacteriales bacterium]